MRGELETLSSADVLSYIFEHGPQDVRRQNASGTLRVILQKLEQAEEVAVPRLVLGAIARWWGEPVASVFRRFHIATDFFAADIVERKRAELGAAWAGQVYSLRRLCQKMAWFQ